MRHPKGETVSEKKSGGIMSVLAHIGVVDEHPDPPGRAAPPHPAAAPPVAPPTALPHPFGPSSFSVAMPPVATPDPETLAKLEARLQKNCPASYTSFMEQYEKLRKAVPDEAMRFNAALAASGTTPEQLLAALDQLIASMDTARTDFQRSFEESQKARVGAADAAIHATEEQIASYEKQLQTVQDTITALRTKHDTDVQAKAADAAKIESVRANFEAALAQVVGRLNAQKSRVATMPRI